MIMRYLLILLLLLSAILCITRQALSDYEPQMATIETASTPIVDPDSMTITEMIEYLAPQYNQNSKLLGEIIFCESSNRTDVPHDGGKGYGVTGYHRETFLEHEKSFGIDLNYDSSYDQIKLMTIAFSKGEKYRNLWSSYKRYTKYGTCDISKIRKLNK